MTSFITYHYLGELLRLQCRANTVENVRDKGYVQLCVRIAALLSVCMFSHVLILHSVSVVCFLSLDEVRSFSNEDHNFKSPVVRVINR
jgi:hypothetical protein